MRFQDAMDCYIQFNQTLEKAVAKFCEEHPDSDLDWWYSFDIQTRDDKTWVLIHWEEDTYCSCCQPDSGCDEFPMSDLTPYIETQWELDQFDRKLEV